MKKALELRPDYYEAQRELAFCYSALGQTDQAIRQYQLASGQRRKAKNSGERAANNLALASLYRKKGAEVGGPQGEEYKKAGKSYEDAAREYDPTLKGAVKKPTAAGVSKVLENLLPEDARKVLEPKSPCDVKVTVPVKVPVKVPLKEPVNETIKDLIKEPVKVPIKEPVKVPVKEPVKKPIKEPVKVPIKVPVNQSGKESSKDPGKKSGKKPEKASVKEPIKVTEKITVKKLLQR